MFKYSSSDILSPCYCIYIDILSRLRFLTHNHMLPVARWVIIRLTVGGPLQRVIRLFTPMLTLKNIIYANFVILRHVKTKYILFFHVLNMMKLVSNFKTFVEVDIFGLSIFISIEVGSWVSQKNSLLLMNTPIVIYFFHTLASFRSAKRRLPDVAPTPYFICKRPYNQLFMIQ